jgi:hypothetical protein
MQKLRLRTLALVGKSAPDVLPLLSVAWTQYVIWPWFQPGVNVMVASQPLEPTGDIGLLAVLPPLGV